MLDYDDGILIGEVMEEVFDEAAHDTRAYTIERDERKKMVENLKQNVGRLAKSYKAKDKLELFESLKRLRVSATRFQFEVWRTKQHKHRLDLEEVE